jgi:non-specific serine/threonine protein kinase/serine/threonine-protein kinase
VASLPPDARTTAIDAIPAEVSPDGRLGPYRLIREIGHGGMGAVYLGVRDDDAFQKRVAIKVLKRGMDTESIVRRFRHERQILASLEHPYIAGLLDGGTTADGRPYFAMEYVEGQSIVDYCDAHRIETRARLDLFRKVCAAVQYAHQNLIIHRDIKPANVLVTQDGTPRLLDFGIAKLLNPELSGHTLAPTAPGLQLMTPEYASPEQVRGDTVTTATDVYSLGVLLYELLAGRLPYRLTSRAPAEIMRIVCESEPIRPSTAVTRIEAEPAAEAETGSDAASGATPVSKPERLTSVDVERLRRSLVGDLDNIVLKALNKEPSRRYASADQFSEDVRRHLAGLPVIARKDTWTYRTTKFVRRNRAAVVAAAMTLVALVAGIIGTTWQARAARAARARAEQRFGDVRHLANAFLFEFHDSIADLEGSTPARKLVVTKGLEYLDKLAQDAGDRIDLRRELADAYLKVGDVQGRPFTPNLGDTAGALTSYRKSVALYESMAGEAAAEEGVRRQLALAYMHLSDVLAAAGDTAGSLSFAQKALAIEKAISSRPTDPPEVRRALVAGHTRVGDMLAATGDVAGALDHRRTALAIMESVIAAAPDDLTNIRQLGVAYQKLGNTLGNPNAPNIGDYAGSLAALERSSTIFREASARYPSNAVFRRNHAVAESNAADVLVAMKRFDEALARERQSFAVYEAQAKTDPTNAAAQNDLAIGYAKLAELLDATGKTEAGLAEQHRATDIHRRLVAADPVSSDMKAELASDHNREATLQAKLGMRDPALANHGRAVDISRELSAASAGDYELRFALALALGGRADAYLQLVTARRSHSSAADLAAAERDYTEALAIYATLQQAGTLTGSDQGHLDNARSQLEKIRAARAVAR